MRPDLEQSGWELESAVARHRADPGTFRIPAAGERSDLRSGDAVKLLFLLADENASGPYVQCERMWVVVEESSEGGYVGKLDNDSVTSGVLRAGDRVSFGPEHVATIWVPRADPRHPDYGP